MHPDILRDLVKAHTSDLHRQAERGALSLASRPPRPARVGETGHAFHARSHHR